MTTNPTKPQVGDAKADPYGILDLKALVAHPNRHMAQMIRGILVSHGAAKVDEVETVAAFNGAVPDRAYDLILIDETFAGPNVLDFIRRFRRQTKIGNHRAPIVLMKTQPTGHDVLDARDAGINEVVIKPISSLMLSKHLSRGLKPKRFIEVKTYVGPDRRFRNLPPPLGIDRRSTLG